MLEYKSDTNLAMLAYKVAVYENLLHQLHTHRCITADSDKIVQILNAIDAWSFAHNCGNGMQSDEDCASNIDAKFMKFEELC